MTVRTRAIIETTAFFTFSVLISSITMLGFAGVDPFTQNAPQVQATAKGVAK